MTESNADFIKRVGAVCEAVSPAPWQADNCGGSGVKYAIRHILTDRPNAALRIATIHDMAPAGAKHEPSHGNAAFIALARTALPEALRRLARLHRFVYAAYFEVQEARGKLVHFSDYLHVYEDGKRALDKLREVHANLGKAAGLQTSAAEEGRDILWELERSEYECDRLRAEVERLRRYAAGEVLDHD